MLIQWGCEIAQKHNVVAYLEATAAGLPVYKKCGFQEVGQFAIWWNRQQDKCRHDEVSREHLGVGCR
jgi:hypothetical protein